MGDSWAQDPNGWSRAVFLLDPSFLPVPSSLSAVFLIPTVFLVSNVSCGTPLRLMGRRWFHMGLDSPPTSPSGKHSDVTAFCISMAPLLL